MPVPRYHYATVKGDTMDPIKVLSDKMLEGEVLCPECDSANVEFAPDNCRFAFECLECGYLFDE